MITQVQVKVPVPIAEYYRRLPAGQRSAMIRRAIDYMLRPSGIEGTNIDERVQHNLQNSKWATIKKGTACTPLNVYIDLTQRQQLIDLAIRLHVSMSALVRLAIDLTLPSPVESVNKEAHKT